MTRTHIATSNQTIDQDQLSGESECCKILVPHLRYRRLSSPEHFECSPYSERRHRVLEQLLRKDTDLGGLKAILSDSSDPGYPLFRATGTEECPVRTVAVGIFDLQKRTWSVYMGTPVKVEPVALLSLDL